MIIQINDNDIRIVDDNDYNNYHPLERVVEKSSVENGWSWLRWW